MMEVSTPLTEGNQVTVSVADTKYKKALKQINKLISINNSCKKQFKNLQEEYDQLLKKYGELQQKYLVLEEQSHSLKGLPNMGKVTMSYQQHNSQISIPSLDQKNETIQQNKTKQNFSPLSIPGKQLQNTGTISEYVDTKRRLEQIEEKLTQKSSQISFLNKKLDIKDGQNAELYKKYIQILNNYNKIVNQIQVKGNKNTEKLEEEKSILENQLTNQRSLTTKLTLEIQNIKKATNNKQVPSEQIIKGYSKNLSTCQIKVQSGLKSVPYHQSYYSIPFQSIKSSGENKQRIDPFSEYYFKKVRDLESEMLKLKKQFAQKKQKYKTQIAKMKQQLIGKQEDLKRLNAFITKQQFFIENYVLKSGIDYLPSNMAIEYQKYYAQSHGQNKNKKISMPSSVSSSISKPAQSSNHLSENKHFQRH